mgnify:CR=1 FL=1
MNDILEANKTLLDLVQRCISKIKSLKTENSELKLQIQNSENTTMIPEEQKREIERLLIETKEILES